MKYAKILTVTAVVASIAMTTTVFASGMGGVPMTTETRPNTMAKCDFNGKGNFKGNMNPMGNRGFAKAQDPLKMLETRKANLQILLKDEKITQEQATSEIAKIDAQIKEVNAFNALTLEQKKAKLTAAFKTNLDNQVKDGRLSQVKADEMLKAHTDMLATWDGNGYPMFGMNGAKGGDFRGKGFKK